MSVPEWLEKAIQYLSMTDAALLQLSEVDKKWQKSEYIGKAEFMKELFVDILPDDAVLEDTNFKRFVFSID